jgi:hypothetical protein
MIRRGKREREKPHKHRLKQRRDKKIIKLICEEKLINLFQYTSRDRRNSRYDNKFAQHEI